MGLQFKPLAFSYELYNIFYMFTLLDWDLDFETCKIEYPIHFDFHLNFFLDMTQLLLVLVLLKVADVIIIIFIDYTHSDSHTQSDCET